MGGFAFVHCVAVFAVLFVPTRAASLSDVARELDCAESTASVLLRRAESRVMGRLVER